MSVRKEKSAVKLGVAGSVNAQWLARAQFNVFKHCFKVFGVCIIFKIFPFEEYSLVPR